MNAKISYGILVILALIVFLATVRISYINTTAGSVFLNILTGSILILFTSIFVTIDASE